MKKKEIKSVNMNKAGEKFPEGEITQGDGGGDWHLSLLKMPKMCEW